MSEEYKVRVPYTESRVRLAMNNDITNRPYYFKPISGIFITLEDELHFWLEERNIEYSLFNIPLPKAEFPNCWWVIFNNKNDAMLFKLYE
jgi:hypothetical protein